jgi:hypothetical protein
VQRLMISSGLIVHKEGGSVQQQQQALLPSCRVCGLGSGCLLWPCVYGLVSMAAGNHREAA